MTQIVSKDDCLTALDAEVQENSKWIKIAEGESKRLQFVLREKPEYKEDTYQGQATGVMKTFWIAKDLNSPNQRERVFRTADKSTTNIAKALRVSKDNVLDITREGTGAKTVYNARVVSPKSESELQREQQR